MEKCKEVHPRYLDVNMDNDMDICTREFSSEWARERFGDRDIYEEHQKHSIIASLVTDLTYDETEHWKWVLASVIAVHFGCLASVRNVGQNKRIVFWGTKARIDKVYLCYENSRDAWDLIQDSISADKSIVNSYGAGFTDGINKKLYEGKKLFPYEIRNETIPLIGIEYCDSLANTKRLRNQKEAFYMKGIESGLRFELKI